MANGTGKILRSKIRLGKITPAVNPFMPTVAFNICCPRACVSRHNGGTRGSPIMPRDAVSRTANVERNGGHKWVKQLTKYCHA